MNYTFFQLSIYCFSAPDPSSLACSSVLLKGRHLRFLLSFVGRGRCRVIAGGKGFSQLVCVFLLPFSRGMWWPQWLRATCTGVHSPSNVSGTLWQLYQALYPHPSWHPSVSHRCFIGTCQEVSEAH